MVKSKDNYFISLIKSLNSSTVDQILDQVLSIQNSNRFISASEINNGFLVSIWTKDELRNEITSGGELITVSDLKSKQIVGYLLYKSAKPFLKQIENSKGISVNLKQNSILGSHLYLYQIGIALNKKRQGLGTILLKDLLNRTTQCIVLDLMAAPFQNHASEHFFSQFGFKEIGWIEYENYRDFGFCRWKVMKLSRKN